MLLILSTLLVASNVHAEIAQQAVFQRPILVVNTSFLNVRTGPSAEFAVLATVAGGTELSVVGTAGDEVWYQAVLPNGQVGWVNVGFTIPRGDFTNVPLVSVSVGNVASVTPQGNVPVVVPSAGGVSVAPVIPADVARAVVIVNTSALNVRVGPGPQFRQLFTAAGGTEFPVLGITSDGLWYGVQTSSGRGFVSSEFVLFRGDANTVPIIEYSTVPQNQRTIETPIVVINTSFLNVRSGPGAQFTQVFTARGGAEFPVLGLASDGIWYLVQTPVGQGWVNNEFVLFRGTAEVVPIIELSNAGGTLATPTASIGSSVQLYAAPGVNFGLLGSVVGPVEAPIVARTPDFDWVQINTSVGFGWVLADQVIIRGDANLIPIVNN